MENASKALIIAGAILISILLISVGILVFNSTSGVTDNAGKTGDVMMSSAELENARIQLETTGIIEDDQLFNKYIVYMYEGDNRTAREVRELCELVTNRCRKLTGEGYPDDENNKTHVTSHGEYPSIAAYWNKEQGKIVYNLDEKKTYKIHFGGKEGGNEHYSVECYQN